MISIKVFCALWVCSAAITVIVCFCSEEAKPSTRDAVFGTIAAVLFALSHNIGD